MKSDKNSFNSPNSGTGVLPLLLPAILIVGAAGMGVTGTLLWMQSHPNTPPAPNPAVTNPTASASGTSIPIGAPSPAGSTLHQPPTALTAGMSPSQAALTLGNWFYDHRAWPLAAENYRRAIAQGIDNPDVRTDYGSALRFSGEPRQALEQYRLAQKQNPRHENSLFNQGGVYASDLKQPAKGIAIWRDYLKKFPGGQSAAQAHLLIVKTQERK